MIYVILRFPDKATYEEEISDFQARFTDSVLIAHNSYYTIQYSAEDYLEYTNDTFFDGLFFDFEIVSANKEEYTISYLNAHVWDYYNDELLVDCLHQLSDKSIE